MITFGAYVPEDVAQVLDITDSTLGENYLNKNMLDQFQKDLHTSVLVFKKATTIVGFAILRHGSLSTLNQAIPIQMGAMDMDEFEKERYLLIQTTAIKKTHQGRGVWSQFLDHVLKKWHQSTEVLMVLCWKYKEEIPLQNILQKNGFKSRLTLNQYWKNDSLNRTFRCPICNEPPCLCDAVLFVK